MLIFKMTVQVYTMHQSLSRLKQSMFKVSFLGKDACISYAKFCRIPKFYALFDQLLLTFISYIFDKV